METSSASSIPTRHLIFIHGGGVGPWMWRAQRLHFHGDYRVHTPILPGHDPAGRPGYPSHPDAARSIAQQVRLHEITGDVTVVGFSLGGQVAIVLADMFPDVIARTVVVSSLVKPWRTGSLLATVAGLAAPLSRSEKFARRQAAEIYVSDEDFEQYFALSSVMSRSMFVDVMRANLCFQPSQTFVATERPALFIAGSEEQHFMLAGLHRLSMAMPTAHFEQIQDVGHGAPLAKAEQFNESLERWLTHVRT